EHRVARIRTSRPPPGAVYSPGRTAWLPPSPATPRRSFGGHAAPGLARRGEDCSRRRRNHLARTRPSPFRGSPMSRTAGPRRLLERWPGVSSALLLAGLRRPASLRYHSRSTPFDTALLGSNK